MVDGTGPGFGFNLGTGLVFAAIIGRDGVRIRCYAKVRPKLGLNSNLVQHCPKTDMQILNLAILLNMHSNLRVPCIRL